LKAVFHIIPVPKPPAKMSQNMKKLEANQKKQIKKDAKNSRVEAVALSDPDAIFGRAIKACGDGWFDIVVQHSTKHRENLVEGRARIGGRSVARIAVNDVLIIARDENGRMEILGNVSAKNAKGLIKERRIPANLLVKTSAEDATEEGGIEFDEEAPAADDEVNVDDI